MEMAEVEKAFDFWVSQFPESHHPLDDRRFYDFVEKASQIDTPVDSEWLTERLDGIDHRMSSEQVEGYGKRLDTILVYLRDRKSL